MVTWHRSKPRLALPAAPSPPPRHPPPSPVCSVAVMFPVVWLLWSVGPPAAAWRPAWWAACWTSPWSPWCATGCCGRPQSRSGWPPSRSPPRTSCCWGRSPPPGPSPRTRRGSASASSRRRRLGWDMHTHTHTATQFKLHNMNSKSLVQSCF